MKSHVHAFNREYRRLLGNVALPAEIANRYQIEDCLNETADKAVFLVRGIPDEMPYILKISSERSREDLALEYALLSALSHPCIPKAITFAKQDGWQYLVREFIPGKTLAALVADSGPLSAREAAGIVIRLCDALSYLHHLNPPIIHRDVKPQNILLANDRRCVLIDFGIARRFDDDAAQDTVCMGTQATAAPEQFGYRQTDIRTDVYSTGILLLFLTTGSFHPNSLPGVPDKRLRQIIRRSIRFDPSDRYPGILPLRRNLRNFLNPWLRLLRPAAMLAVLLFSAALLLPRLLSEEDASADVSVSLPPNTVTLPPVGESYTFYSPQIEQAVREQLRLGAGDPVTQSDLDRITGLYICGKQTYPSWDSHDYYSNTDYIDGQREDSVGVINTLADLTNMHQLTELALYNQMIVDIAPLGGLPLTKLGLGGNRIEDVSALAALTNLTELYLEKNPLRDIEPLQTLYQLEYLDLSGTQTADISPLSDRPLVFLSLMDCPVRDTSPLLTLPKLNWLCLSDLPQEQAAVCGQIHSLNNLTLYRCGVTSLEPYAALENLSFLDLLGNELTDMNGLERYPLLSGLCIRDNPIMDLTPLKKLSKLTYINIGGVSATDFAPLKDIPGLTRIDCSPDQLEAIQGVLSGRDVAISAF